MQSLLRVKQQFQKELNSVELLLQSGAVTSCFEETLNEVLFHSFPDCENDGDDYHKEIRNDALINNA
ncbi:hypothetical protein TNCV_650021 [Trichonephila clavipes]|nr:hypothetical protein TNCV_650021 [Trichonephila clavipes]